MPVDISQSKSCPLPDQLKGDLHLILDRGVGAMLRALGIAHWHVSILLCGEEEIQCLNRRYRQQDKPTDVLAFPLHELPSEFEAEARSPGPKMLGDLVLSTSAAEKQARERGVSLANEALYLLAHALLHLLSLDHRDHHEDRRMRARCDLLHHLALRS